MAINEVVAVVLLLTALFLFFAGMTGLLRLPDFYCRLHATGMGDSLAVVIALVGVAAYEGVTLNTFKILCIIVFLFLAQPTGTHLLTQASLRRGLTPWKKGDERQ